MFMRVCSICATLAFLLGVLVVLYLWPVFNRGLQSSSYRTYNAGYAGSGGYGGRYGGYRSGDGGYGYGSNGGYGGDSGYGQYGGYDGYGGYGMAEAHLAGHGVSRHMRSMPPINLGRGQRLPPVIRPAINRPPLARPAETALYRRKAKALKRVRASLATR